MILEQIAEVFSKLNRFDIFGKSISLNYSNNDKYKTKIGT